MPKEDLEKIPSLKLDDISKEIEKISCKQAQLNGCDVYYNEDKTNKISYIDLTFNSMRVNAEDISYINLLANLLTEVSTTNMSYDDIAKKTGIAAGDIDSLHMSPEGHEKLAQLVYDKLNEKSI